MSDSVIAPTGTTPTPADAPASTVTETPAPSAPAPASAAPAASLLGATEATPTATDGTQPAPASADAPAEPAAPAPQVPETYDLKSPDGGALDGAAVKAFTDVAKEVGLSQEAAQKIVDAIAPKIAEQNTAEVTAAIAAYRADLVAKVKADKEIGGDKLTEVLSRANEAVKAYGGDELRKVLNETGLGDHPEVIRAFYKIGKDISNSKFVPGASKPTKGETDAASKLYPKT